MCMFDINWVSAKCSSIDLCSNLPCGEHGICQNNPHDFTCLCDDGFIRDQCKEYNFCVLRYYIFVFCIEIHAKIMEHVFHILMVTGATASECERARSVKNKILRFG